MTQSEQTLMTESTSAVVGSGVRSVGVGLGVIRDSFSGAGNSLDAALQSIFTSRQEETKLHKARRIMGCSLCDISDSDLEAYLTEFQYLLDEWFDMFERQLYGGKTLRILLQE